MTKQDVLKTQMISLFLIQPDSVMLGKTLKLNFAKRALQCYLLYKCSPLGLSYYLRNAEGQHCH